VMLPSAAGVSSLLDTGESSRQNHGTGSDQQKLAMLKDIIPRVAGIRRPGSAALDLAYVAAGRYDGFWELQLAPWDIAAGCLLITEAGGLVGDLEGNDTYMESGNIIAGNPKIFGQLLQVIAPHLTKELMA